MRAVVQRVMSASVTVGDELISSVGRGICVLIGISRDDTPKDMEYIVRKILNLRVFDDDSGKRWSKSVMDKQYEVLCVSQFTLYSILKGNKPDFHSSMGGDDSQTFYNDFLAQMKKAYKPEMIKDGQFGAYMQVNIQNDGPVTIQLESPANVQGNKGKQSVKDSKKTEKKQDTKEEASSSTSAPQGAAKTEPDVSSLRLDNSEKS